MAFSFGQAPGAAFGAPSSTPAFGAPASSGGFSFGGGAAPASSAGFGFGGGAAPAFGAAPASSGGFGFGGAAAPASSGGFGFGGGAAPAFGAAPASSGGFGFGGAAAPASSGGFGFGGGATPAFGAAPASSGGFSFGGGSAATGSLFGAASAPTGSPFGGSLFGAAPPATGSALTLAPASGAASSIFGAAAALAPGASAPAAAPFAPVALAGAGAVAAGPAAASDPARELQEIANCYTPGHSSYKFSHLFLSVVRPEQRVRPAGVDELSWKQAIKEAGGENNPDGLWPVQANGFGDLLKRAQAQGAAIEENRQRLSELRDLAHKLSRRQESEIRGRIQALQARHVELSQRLLGVARCVDGLEGRLAMYMGARGDVSRGREGAIAATLDAAEGELSLAAAGSLQRRADVVAAAVRLRASGGAAPGAAGPGAGGAQALDDASMSALYVVLQDHADALARLQEVLRRDVLDVEVMKGGPRDQTAPAGLGIAVLEAA
ncbi:nuclear pore complex [Raphidocelis subcapitata]|uniref:Nuclear pore complex n=1 Tax=Raphidocelis subcapitata TaxID=307507 RepID=A0A2V0NWZ5_9CHLO|nr:nuclear pore complex [Raphidocelis subcapitata]|eukprot:GBF92146.1 nuclear pore complex [Raphidocelis subcapitata]